MRQLLFLNLLFCLTLGFGFAEEGATKNSLEQAAVVGAVKDAQGQAVAGVHVWLEAVELLAADAISPQQAVPRAGCQSLRR